MAIYCEPPSKTTYNVGRFEIVFRISSDYATNKVCRVALFECSDPQCSSGEFLGQTDDFTVEAGKSYTIELTLEIENEGYYLIGVYNVTDGKGECGFVISVASPITQMMQMMMQMMPILIIFPMFSSIIPAFTKITEAFKR